MTSDPTSATAPLPVVQGHVAAGFEPVAEAFMANWADQDELGAGFAVRLGGEIVVDIHAGWADRKKTRAWQAGTLVPVYSTGKAIAALVIARLVDRGLLDYDAPVADFWPEFAASGKSAVTVAQALSHQAGLSRLSEEMDAADWFNAKLIEATARPPDPALGARHRLGLSPGHLRFHRRCPGPAHRWTLDWRHPA